MRLEFDTGWVSESGGREANEDFHGYANAGGFHCWVIADGLGGHEDGAIASQLVVSTVLDAFRAKPAIAANAVKAYIQGAHAAIQAHQIHTTDKSQMGATLVVLVSDGAVAVWGHVGDSRLFHIRGGRVLAETRDHSLHQVKAGAAAQPGSNQRSDDRSSLLQAVGLSGQILPSVTKSPQHLMPGDAFVLCVDGFWEKVFEPEIEADFAGSRDSNGWLHLLRRRIKGRLREGDDNYTAIAVRARGPVVAMPPEAGKGWLNWLPRPRDAGIMTGLGVLAVILSLLLHLYHPAHKAGPVDRPSGGSGSIRASGSTGVSGGSGARLVQPAGGGTGGKSTETSAADDRKTTRTSGVAENKTRQTHGKLTGKNTTKTAGHGGAGPRTGAKAPTAPQGHNGASGSHGLSGPKGSTGATPRTGAQPATGAPPATGTTSPPGAALVAPARGKWNYPVVFQHGGTFEMGSEAWKDSKPVHTVTISRDLCVGKYEISRYDWYVVTTQDKDLAKCRDCPVANVSWSDVVAFANAASRLAGFGDCYTPASGSVKRNAACSGYRLPTEAEWELAAKTTLGEHPSDPEGPLTSKSSLHVLRGCSFKTANCEPERRRTEKSNDGRETYIGFRLVRTDNPAASCRNRRSFGIVGTAGGPV